MYLVNGQVHREVIRLGGTARHSLVSSTKWIAVNLTPGKDLKNFYWMVGPGQGDTGRRITVLHNNQPKQCSWCFLYTPPSLTSLIPSQHCRNEDNGKACKTLGTPRARMKDYVD